MLSQSFFNRIPIQNFNQTKEIIMSLRNKLLNTFLLPEPFGCWKATDTLDADFICPQAFGRNTYSDKEVGPRVRTAREALGSDREAFEWLRLKRFDAGRPNTRLALLCHSLATALDRPIIGQWEVMHELYCNFPEWYKMHEKDLFTIWPPVKGYLATRGLLLDTEEIAKEYGWKTPIVVAHPEHIQRRFFLAREIFQVIPAVSTGTISNTWFDEDSVQVWTKGKWRWLVYELFLARPHHRLNGWF